MSDRRVTFELADWWPPKVGDKLRGVWGPEDIGEDPLYHVVAVFRDKEGHERIVTAEWWKSKQRWNYAVHHAYEATNGMLRPDRWPRVEK